MLGHQPSLKHYIRVVATYGLLAIAVIGGTYFVVQLARGYQINLSQQQLELTGLIRFESNPDANIIIDGQQSGEQTPARLSLVEGLRQITLEQTGYQRWSRQIDVDGGSVHSITYPFLIPFDVEDGTEVALDLAEIDAYAFDHNNSLLAVASEDRINVYQLLDNEFDEPYRQIDLAPGAKVERFIWAESSEQLLFLQSDEARQRWQVADISQSIAEVTDISDEVGQLEPQGFVVDEQQQVLLSGEQELWLLSIENLSLQLLTRRADAFTFNNSGVVWHEKNEPEILKSWSRGEAASIPVLTDITTSPELAVSSYSNQTNIAYTHSGKTRVIANALSAPFERELESFDEVSDISPGGRFVSGVSDSGQYIVHDIDQNLSYEFKLVDQLSTLKWSGTHHFIARGESGVYVVDFDGSNQRRINFVQANSGVLNAQKTAVFSVADTQLLITPLR